MGLFSSSKNTVNTDVNVAISTNPNIQVDVDVAPIVAAQEAQSKQNRSLLEEFFALSQSSGIDRDKLSIAATTSLENQLNKSLGGTAASLSSAGKAVSSSAREVGGMLAFSLLAGFGLLAMARA